jgi:hypothetical protein
MARTITSHYIDEPVEETSLASSPVYQAFMILLVGFTAAPLIAGVDKFFGLLTDWTQYLAPVFPNLVHLTPMSFMKIVGVIEVIAAFLVAWKPRTGGYVVAAWLLGINLLLLHSFYDIALRDLGLAIGAVALARLGEHFGR